ncbi:MAG: hypothetical protein H6834_08885 [Planctomycetes bacterium]|nr:hypothetical protein [Planctomycetota bacterium]MCB9891980.1 hypothetical protein [Planctomycetota bacterium]
MPRTSFAFGLALFLLPGCFSPTHRIAQRTALEQQLTSLAIDRAVAALQLADANLPDYLRLEVVGPTDVPTAYVRHRVERELARLGTRVAETPHGTYPSLEIEVAVAGNDLENTLVGIPLSTTGGGVPVADVSLFKVESQYGRARLSAILRKPDGEILTIAEDVGGSSSHSMWTVLTFIGPFINTDVDEFWD